MDYKLELVLIPVSDLDRVRDFYTQAAGVTLEVDGPAGEGARICAGVDRQSCRHRNTDEGGNR